MYYLKLIGVLQDAITLRVLAKPIAKKSKFLFEVLRVFPSQVWSYKFTKPYYFVE